MLDALPPHLTHLGSVWPPTEDKDVFDAWVEHLPKSLTSWDYNGKITVDQVSSRFPPSLTHLQLEHPAKSIKPTPVLFSMPYLTKLAWTQEDLDDLSFGLNAVQLAHLPSTITSLQIPRIVVDSSTKPIWPRFLTDLCIVDPSNFNKTVCLSLPPELTTLHLRTYHNHYFPLPLVAFIPRSITDLEIHRSCHFTLDDGGLIDYDCMDQRERGFDFQGITDPLLPFMFEAGMLPPNLARFCMQNHPSLNADSLVMLPNSVTELIVSLVGSFVPNHARSLPPQLKIFKSTSHVMHLYANAALPHTLTTLSLGRVTPEYGGKFWRSDVELFAHLPPTLTKLIISAIHSSAWTNEAPLRLPSSIVHLRLGSWKMVGYMDKSVVCILPPHLTRLSIAINDLACAPIDLMDKSKREGLPDSEWFDQLPRKLRVLKLQYPYSTVVTLGKEYLDHLPPLLTKLDVAVGGLRLRDCGLVKAFKAQPPHP